MVDGIAANTNVIVLFLTVPFLNVPLKHGGYLPHVEALFRKKAEKNYQVYGFCSLLSFFIGSIFNLAGLHITYQLLGRAGSEERKKLVALSLIRGFTACVFWAPSLYSVSFVLSITGVPWIKLFPYGIVLSAATLLIGFTLDRYEKKLKKVPEVMGESGAVEGAAEVSFSKLVELVAAGMMLLFSLIFLETLLNVDILVIVPTVFVLVSFVWLFYLKRALQLPRILKSYYHEEIPKHSNEVALFTGAGMFGSVLASSGLGEYITEWFQGLAGMDPFYVVFVIGITISVVYIFGINPIVTVTAMMVVISELGIEMNMQFLALGIISGWAIGVVISPFSMANLTMARLSNKSPLEIAFKDNFVYALLLTPVVWGLLAVIFKLFFAGV